MLLSDNFAPASNKMMIQNRVVICIVTTMKDDDDIDCDDNLSNNTMSNGGRADGPLVLWPEWGG